MTDSSLLAASRRPERTAAAIANIKAWLHTDWIRNADYQDAKRVLNIAFEDAFRAVRDSRHYQDQPDDVRRIYDECMPMSLHDAFSTAKKIDAVFPRDGKPVSDTVAAFRKVIDEALPLAEMLRDLKSHIVKGRTPAPEKPVNPDKVMKTCPCCFRSIAVQTGTMAHHGYKRPGDGFQTASCMAARRFRPFEESNRGTVFLLDKLREDLDEARKDRQSTGERLDHSKTLDIQRRRPRIDGGGTFTVTVTRGTPEFARAVAAVLNGIDSNIRHIEHHLKFVEEKLEGWKPESPDAEDYRKPLSSPSP